MNTYNENLQQTVVNTLSALSLSQANLDSTQTVAEITLYQAQGAQLTARDKLSATQGNQSIWQGISDQGRQNESQVINLLASATESNTDVTTSITNTATAAANVQIASNAISVLAADVGAALNIAIASLYETDVYNKIESANSFINEVANESKRIAKDAMNTTGYASEITTKAVLAQTQTLKSKIDTIFSAAQAQLNGFSTLAITENTQLCQTCQAERKAEGALKDATSEVQAIDTAYLNANLQLNYGLSIAVQNTSTIQVSFQGLPKPLPKFQSSDAKAIAIPDANPKYYLALLPAQNQSIFLLDQAQQLFEQRLPTDTKKFHAIEPGLNRPVTLTQDVYGSPIKAGSGYVAYLYIELSMAYKQFISNFSDLLSAPSQAFTPAITLLSPNKLDTQTSTGSDKSLWTTLVFADPGTPSQGAGSTGATMGTGAGTGTGTPAQDKAVTVTSTSTTSAIVTADGTAVDVDVITTRTTEIEASGSGASGSGSPSAGTSPQAEYRCILIEKNLDPYPHFQLSQDNNNPPLYFNLTLAEQVAPSNYTMAQLGKDSKYVIQFKTGCTDNFGNMIEQGVEYSPYVLTVATNNETGAFVNALTGPYPSLVVYANAATS